MPLINSFTNWGKLEEVWLGDCYPAAWYDHLPSEVRDVFYELTEKTKQDLTIIENKIKEFGVVVQRPRYTNIERFLNHGTGQLLKPEITPRDQYLVAGNCFIGGGLKHNAWVHLIDQYRTDPSVQVLQIPRLSSLGHISGANTVRTGRDIYLDIFYRHAANLSGSAELDNTAIEEFHQHIVPHFDQYRIHLLNNGGHVDGCFAAIAPGVLLTSAYFDDYERTFPGWKKINIFKPEFWNKARRSTPNRNGKWWESGSHHSHDHAFNDHVIKHALDWVGNYTETYFEVNCLVIDEKNVLILGENDTVFRELERHGITAHSLPFRTRTFWDGGLHCLTLDIRRQDSIDVDVFPDRDQKIYMYNDR